MTVTCRQANNKSSNAEPIAFWQLINEIFLLNLDISFITTDSSPTLHALLENEYNEIRHHLNIWHILRNTYQKFTVILTNNKLFSYLFFIFE